MFLAFFAWYHGLALGGVARIGQVQLAQPVLTLLWSALLLGEDVTGSMASPRSLVLACVVATQRSRQVRRATADQTVSRMSNRGAALVACLVAIAGPPISLAKCSATRRGTCRSRWLAQRRAPDHARTPDVVRGAQRPCAHHASATRDARRARVAERSICAERSARDTRARARRAAARAARRARWRRGGAARSGAARDAGRSAASARGGAARRRQQRADAAAADARPRCGMAPPEAGTPATAGPRLPHNRAGPRGVQIAPQRRPRSSHRGQARFDIRDTVWSAVASPPENAGGGVPSISTGTSRQGHSAPTPRGKHPEHHDVMHARRRGGASAESTPSRRNPTRSSARCERPLRVFAHAVSRSMPSRWNASAQTIALPSKFAPEPHQRCPSQEPTVARRSRRASSDRPVTPMTPSTGSTSTKSSSVPSSRLAHSAEMYASGCSSDVYGPHEKKRVTAGSARARTAAARRRHRVAQRKPRPADDERVALVRRHGPQGIHRAHGGPALRRAREPPGARGGPRGRRGRRRATSSAATTRCSAAGRRRRSSACRQLPDALWIRGNGERWLTDPDTEIMNPVALEAVETAQGGARRRSSSQDLAALPSTARRDDTADLPRLTAVGHPLVHRPSPTERRGRAPRGRDRDPG